MWNWLGNDLLQIIFDWKMKKANLLNVKEKNKKKGELGGWIITTIIITTTAKILATKSQ